MKAQNNTNRGMIWITLLLLVIITIWWLVLKPFNLNITDEQTQLRYIWGSTYQIIALWGAVCGFIISKWWGGFKSITGRAIIAFSFGLLLQVFGQSVYSYYNLVAHIEAPYPSIGDIGFFGSIFGYLYAVVQLAHASGVKVSLKSFSNQFLAVIIPLLMLLVSYTIFLRGYEYDWTRKLAMFLDFGYPLGQALYVSLALLVLLLSRSYLGGIMKKPVLLLVFALIIQYIADFNFLYQAYNETWYVAGYGDYLYVLAYFLMACGVIYIGGRFKKLEDK